jgi:predicted acetyltransferase
LRDSFPKEISPEGLKNLELNYRRMIEDDALMQELESIMEFAVPQFKSSLDEGSFIYDYVESQCEISPVGLTSLYANEGYLVYYATSRKGNECIPVSDYHFRTEF